MPTNFASIVIRKFSRRIVDTPSFWRFSAIGFAVILVSILGACSSTSGPDNRPPGTPSKPTGPFLAVINRPATFTASSTDLDNNLSKLTFFWDGQDTTVVSLSGGASSGSATHTYTRLGSFQIFVVATDISGLRSDSSDGLRIDVVKPGPLPPTKPTGADTAFLTQRYSFSSSAISPDADSLFLTFRWGDGSSTNTGWDTSGANFNASHIYYDTGVFIIRVEATDDSNRVSLQSIGRTIQAINQAPLKPSAPFGPQTAIVGELVTFKSATADPEGDFFTMTFEWGDGFNIITALGAGDREYSAPHQYSDTGIFAVRVSATDIFGNLSDTSQTTLIHIPIFPSDTVQFIGSALDKQIVTLSKSWSVTWINRDQGEVHKVVSDLTDTLGLPIFGPHLIKSDTEYKLVFETSGVFRYHCEIHPADVTETGTVTVN